MRHALHATDLDHQRATSVILRGESSESFLHEFSERHTSVLYETPEIIQGFFTRNYAR